MYCTQVHVHRLQLFFDDEKRNREVESLGTSKRVHDPRIGVLTPLSGVTFSLVPSGVSERAFQHGLELWRKRHPIEVVEDAAGTAEE